MAKKIPQLLPICTVSAPSSSSPTTGAFFSYFFKPMSRSAVLKYAAAILALALGMAAPAADAYVLEGKSWPAGSTVIMQLNLGSAGRTLQDGNTSWDDAVLPVAGMWNQTIQRVQVSTILNSVVPTTSGDRLNAVFFSNSIFGQ